MNKIYLIYILISLLSFNYLKAEEIRAENASIIEHKEIQVPWNSPEGMTRLQNAVGKEQFWNLIRYYEAQMRSTYCGIATSVITLNSISVEAPQSKYLGKYRMFTQEEFFTDTINAVVEQSTVAKQGIALEQLALVLKTFPIEVTKHEAMSLSHEEIRELLIAALDNPHQAVLGLYQRKSLQQIGGGHWSPIAAYDQESDSFLILDVARFKYPPTWVDATAFINSMQTENIQGKSRGFIIIENLGAQTN